MNKRKFNKLMSSYTWNNINIGYKPKFIITIQSDAETYPNKVDYLVSITAIYMVLVLEYNYEH